MAYTSNNGLVIKSNIYPWLMIIAGIIAVLVIFYFLFGFSVPQDANPEWAPEGCTIRMYTDRYPRVRIRINNFENFNTDAEIATLLLTTLENGNEFFNDHRTYNNARLIEIEFPESQTGVKTRYVQYLEQAYQGVLRCELHVREGSVDLYNGTIASTLDLEKMADGSLDLNLIQYLLE